MSSSLDEASFGKNPGARRQFFHSHGQKLHPRIQLLHFFFQVDLLKKNVKVVCENVIFVRENEENCPRGFRFFSTAGHLGTYSVSDPDPYLDSNPAGSTTFGRIRIRNWIYFHPCSGSKTGSGSTSISFPGVGSGSGSTKESIDLDPGSTKTNQNYVGKKEFK